MITVKIMPNTAWNTGYSVGSSVLAALGRSDDELGVTDISAALGMDKSVVHRILATLKLHDFVAQNPKSKKYRIGIRAWEVGRKFVVSSWLDQVAMPLLTDVVKQSGGTGYVGCLDGTDVVYLAVVHGPGTFQVHVDVGARLVAHTNALGRSLLSRLPVLERREVLSRIEDQVGRSGPMKPVDELERDLDAIRERGYAENRGESRQGVGAVGAPIVNQSGYPIAALSVAFPLLPEFEGMWSILPPKIMAVASEVSRRLG
jgi:IclR family KDG regulon transcriptional repressor